MHARQAIRDAAAALLDGLPTTGSRVLVGRVYPHADGELPALTVSTPSEAIEAGESTQGFPGAQPQERRLVLEVAAHARGATVAPLDTLDTISEEVEAALAADATLGGACDSMMLVETAVEATDEQQTPVGALTLRYMVHYRTDAQAPGTVIQ